MFPSWDQIQRAAYERWERRGGGHGHDHDDWLDAERDLVFGLNYAVLARYRLDGPRTILGDRDLPLCRFCERSEPQATFDRPVPAVPACLGNTALDSYEECGECHDQFRSSIEVEFERFCRPFLHERPRGPVPSYSANGSQGAPDEPGRPRALTLCSEPYIPVAAYKALVRSALLLMPEHELSYFADAVEWVANPDHAQDAAALGALACQVYFPHVPFPAPWVSLVRRTDDEAPFPYMMLFAGTTDVVFQVHVPFCTRDEDLDGSSPTVPRISLSCGEGPEFHSSACLVVPLGSADLRREARLDLFDPG